MRLTATLVVLLAFFFICSVAQGYYTVTPDKTFFVGHTTYCFNQTINVTTIGKDGFWFIVDDLRMMALTVNDTSLLVRINRFNSSLVNFTYCANKSCEIFFNCSGLVFTKVYLGGNETLQVSLPVNASSVPYRNDPVGDLIGTPDNPATSILIQLLPLMIMIGFMLFLASFMMRI